MSRITSTLCSIVLTLAGCGDGSHGAAKRIGSPGSQSPHPRLDFVTKDQAHYSLDIRAYEAGVVVVEQGNRERPLRFYEAGPVHRRNVELNDYFVLTDSHTGITRIVQYVAISQGHRRLFFDDPARQLFSVRYDAMTRIAQIPVGTKQFKLTVEQSNPSRLATDQNGDAFFESDKVPIVTFSGRRIYEEELK